MNPKNKKPSRMDELLMKLKIDDTLTKPIFYKFPTVKENVFPKAFYNYQADTLMLPTTKEGYRYLLVMVDLWSNYFDIEPVKNKEAETMKKAMESIFKRKILKEPKSSIITDAGTEFKSSFTKYLYENSIMHKVTLPDRHKQLGNVERVNRDLGKIFMTYLTDKSNQLGYDYNEWTDLVDTVRTELNDIKTHFPDLDPTTRVPPSISLKQPKYKLGDMVYRRLEIPRDRFGNKYHNSTFRGGDSRFEINEPRKIVNVLAYKNSWRYLINGFPNVSYDEAELMPAKEKDEKYIVHQIIGKKIIKGKVHYLVWWKKYNKSESTWEPKTNLLEDGADEYIQEYEDKSK
jgi:hypothetical protein